jgi:GDP-D-mannose dehydratase
MNEACIGGISGNVGHHMTRHALDWGDEVVHVCRERGVGKLERFKGRTSPVPGATDDRPIIKLAVLPREVQ